MVLQSWGIVSAAIWSWRASSILLLAVIREALVPVCLRPSIAAQTRQNMQRAFVMLLCNIRMVESSSIPIMARLPGADAEHQLPARDRWNKREEEEEEEEKVRDNDPFLKSASRPCQDQMAVDTDAASLSENQGASTCARCWPLGASELGYCICSDLVLAGILHPASGND